MRHTSTSTAPWPQFAQFVVPVAGMWMRFWVNLLLRVLVKWRHGLRIDVAAVRARQLGLDRHVAPSGSQVRRESVCIEGVNAEWVVPPLAHPSRVLLYLHGGAFVARSPAIHAGMVTPWCELLSARALMVDYRLAPEHAHPAALDDCHAVYRWLLEQGHDASSIVLGGDSAGGNLALALLHRIKRAGEPMPACAVLLSPFVDFTLSSPSIVTNARRDPLFTPAFALAIRAQYAPPTAFLDPDVSPLYGDFADFPPMLIQAGSTEMLVDDALRTAERADAAGVAVVLEIWDRLPHVFQALQWLPQAREAADHIVRFIVRNAGWITAERPAVETSAVHI